MALSALTIAILCRRTHFCLLLALFSYIVNKTNKQSKNNSNNLLKLSSALLSAIARDEIDEFKRVLCTVYDDVNERMRLNNLAS